MKYSLRFGTVVWVACNAFLFAQSNPSSTEQKQETSATSTSQNQQSPQLSTRRPIEILSDTMGVDFDPYLSHIAPIVKKNWYSLMPPSVYPPVLKQGKVSIEFSIRKDGKVSNMAIRTSSGDVPLDRAAWGCIIASNPLPSLPKEFPGKPSPYASISFTTCSQNRYVKLRDQVRQLARSPHFGIAICRRGRLFNRKSGLSLKISDTRRESLKQAFRPVNLRNQLRQLAFRHGGEGNSLPTHSRRFRPL